MVPLLLALSNRSTSWRTMPDTSAARAQHAAATAQAPSLDGQHARSPMLSASASARHCELREGLTLAQRDAVRPGRSERELAHRPMPVRCGSFRSAP